MKGGLFAANCLTTKGSYSEEKKQVVLSGGSCSPWHSVFVKHKRWPWIRQWQCIKVVVEMKMCVKLSLKASVQAWNRACRTSSVTTTGLSMSSTRGRSGKNMISSWIRKWQSHNIWLSLARRRSITESTQTTKSTVPTGWIVQRNKPCAQNVLFNVSTCLNIWYENTMTILD